MSEGSHLGVGEAGEERDDRVHHVLVVDDAVLTLADQDGDELAEVVAELLPHGAGHRQRVVAAVLQEEGDAFSDTEHHFPWKMGNAFKNEHENRNVIFQQAF